jgi:hypothetical protein
MQHTLARLILLLSGHWRLAFGRIGPVRWDFASAGWTLLTIGAVVALLVAIICYRQTTEGLSPRARLGLGALRLAALLSLLVMVSGAVCAIDSGTEEKPRLLVLVDDSPSMTLPTGTSTRLAAAQAALDQDGLRNRLAANFDVRVATTSGKPAGSADPMPQNLAEALVRESTKSSDRPVSQILLVSDGMQLGSTELSRAASELPAPVSTLCVGAADVRDVILQGVSVPPYVYVDDRALVTAEVRSLGFSGEVVLQLYELAGAGESHVADTRATVKAGQEPAIARLQFVAKTAGLQRYKLRVMPVENELTDRNNEIAFHLDVRPEKIRVLFVEGSPSWEYKFVKEAMEKDPAIEFYGMVRLPGDEWLFQGNAKRPDGKPVIASPKDGFPASPDELNFFDVLIVGDLERKLFERENRYELVDSFVKNHAGGVATIGGLQVYAAGDYAGTPLARLVPFEIEKEKKQQLINRFTPQLTASGLMHPTMQLEFDPVLNARAWAEMPWVEGGSAIRQVKPSATLLMVHPKLKTTSGMRPIAAAWQYGAGRVFSTALDGTWHWRLAQKNDEVNYHARYWGLIARWLASDPRSGRASGSMMLEDPVLEVGKPVVLSLMLRDKNGSPVIDADADFTIAAPSGKKLFSRSKSDPAVPGQYALTFTPAEAGDYAVNNLTTRKKVELVKQEQHFLIGPSRAEFLDPRADAKALSDLAAVSGGSSALLGQHAHLVLPTADRGVSITHTVVPVWQLPALMGLVIVTLSTEWLMRKRRGLS